MTCASSSLAPRKTSDKYVATSIEVLAVGGFVFQELQKGLCDPLPGVDAVNVANGHAFLGTLSGDKGGIFAMSPQQEIGSAPDIDLNGGHYLSLAFEIG